MKMPHTSSTQPPSHPRQEQHFNGRASQIGYKEQIHPGESYLLRSHAYGTILHQSHEIAQDDISPPDSGEINYQWASAYCKRNPKGVMFE